MIHRLKHYSILFFFVLFLSFAQADQESLLDEMHDSVITVTLDFFKDSRVIEESLSIFPESFFLNELQFETDVDMQAQERDYILGFTQGVSISRKRLTEACLHIKMKNKFSQAELSLLKKQDGYQLTIKLESVWTFNKVLVQGLLRGAEKYRHLYLLEFGEPFDKAKHTHSIEKISDALKANGFFKSSVIDYLNYDSKTKTISVTLVIDSGYEFIISDVALKFTSSGQEDHITDVFKKKVCALFVPRLKGHSYTHELLIEQKKFLKQYFAKKGFLNARIAVDKEVRHDEESIFLSFTITLNQKKAITFFGNHFFSNSRLFDTIFAFGRSTALLPDSFLIQEIIDAYQKKGFWEIEVTTKQENKRNYFLIKEGARTIIKAVTIKGAENFNNKIMQSFFSSFLKQSFDEDYLRQALQKLANFYSSQGFLDCKISSQEYKKIEEPAVYEVCINLVEGTRRFLKSVSIENFPEFAKMDPFVCCNGKDAVPFDPNQIQVHRQWLMNYFQQKGFLYVDAKPEIDFKESDVRIIWKISGIDQVVKFGKIIVLGSTSFPFENIVRELSFKEGDVWQKQKLEDSLKRLRKMGIFETIYLSPNDISQQESHKAIIIKLLQDEPFEIRLRAGFQQVSKTLLEFRKGTTYKFGGTALYKNPFNAGDYFCIDTDFTRFYRNISVEYQRPWFFSMPLNTVIKGYSNKYIQPVHIGSDKPLYQAIQQGFLFGVNRCCSSVNFGVNIGVEVMETNKLSIEMARAINFETVLVDKQVPYIYTEPDIVVDFLDNDVNPTYGTLTVFSCQIMAPLRRVSTTFFKFLFEHSVFFPLSWISSVVAMRFRAGHIFNQDFPNIMPPLRFFIGGQNSLRSYDQDFGPPLGSFMYKGKRILVPQGGKSLFNMNFELRFPLFWSIGAVLFQDIGFLADRSFTEVVKSHFLAGTGFGIRYYTPIGPVRFDLGWKWKKHVPEESWYAWFLTLGHAF